MPAIRLIALAAIAGILAGGVAVYVKGDLAGNTGAGSAPQVAADARCADEADRGKAVAAAATGGVAAMLAADPSQSLSGLAFNAPDGKPMTLDALKDKIVLLNLWATWCAPCRAEMPALDALQEKMGGDGFQVVAVNVDTGGDEKPKKFLAETGVKSLAYYRENTLGLFDDLKRRGLALGLPVTLLVDRNGCLLAHMNGPAEWQGPDAQRLVEAALAGS
jgi:thiol-disulfide isomerase/thioredoxin